MADDYTNEVIIYGMFGGVQTAVAVDEDGNLQAVLLGEYAGAPKQIALDENGKIAAILYGVHAGIPTPVYVDEDGRIGTMATDPASVSADGDEVQSWSATLVSLVSNLNRIRYMIVTITGEAWGTASHSIAAIWAKFHDTTGHGHSGSGSDGAPIHHGATTGRGDDDHTQYLLADGTRALSGALSMGTHKLTDLVSGTNPKDAVTLDQISGSIGSWATWTPTLGWSGGTPGSPITKVARWIQIGNLVLFYLDISSEDSNACTGLTVTLPATPSNKSAYIPLSSIEDAVTSAGGDNLYPPEQTDTYVKATGKTSTDYWPYYATDPTKSLSGVAEGNTWRSAAWANIEQCFHIDIGTAAAANIIYYENFHASGVVTNCGVKTFTIWGSNEASAFADLDYTHDTNWTQITASQATFDEHNAYDSSDPKYIALTNTTAYRYYRLKIADNWGWANGMGIRRIVLRTGSVSGSYNPMGYIIADGADNRINFKEFHAGVDGGAVRVLVSGQYEVD